MSSFLCLFKPFLLACLVATTLAADCFTNQQRKNGDPTGAQIATALRKDNQIDFVCGGNWRVNDNLQLQNTFNHGLLFYEVTRADKNQPLRYCKDAMNNIIDQCISNGNYWGGVWSLNGETYNITNSAYPNNPLMVNDDGGPPSTGTSGTGPITTQTGSFTTKTTSIAGLTANSATTTTSDGHPTILPIWFVGPDSGIIVIPPPGIVPGGIVPPPHGFPPLTINPDGKPQTVDDKSNNKDSSTSTKTSTTSSCTSACVACYALGTPVPESQLTNDGDPDLPDLDPKIWEGMSIPSSSPIQASSPTQSAVPIDQPACVKSKVTKNVQDTINKIPASDKTIDLNALLYRIRQKLCAGPCSTPIEGIPDDSVAIYDNNGECEIAVGLSPDVEAYFYRGTAPSGDQWQQCWDSTENIINKCIKDGSKEGWWNGNHVYQFYQGGVRPLNGEGSKHTKKINAFPHPSWDSLTCEKDCVSYVPDPNFCVAHCPQCTRDNVCRRWVESDAASLFKARSRASRILQNRAVETISTVGRSCSISYSIPDYPSAGTAEGYAQVGRWYDRRPATCALDKLQDRIDGHSYHTEHVWEKHFLKSFFYWLISGVQFDTDIGRQRPIISCQTLQAVFNTRGVGTSAFLQETAASQLGKAISCSGSQCPDNNRISEFFLLQSDLNNLKNKILSGMNLNNNVPVTQCKNTYAEAYEQMQNSRAVFGYMARPEVFKAFNNVHTRVRAILRNLDNDATLGINKPDRLSNYTTHFAATWEGAYQEFIARLLQDAERKMKLFMYDCSDKMKRMANAAGNQDYDPSVSVFKRDDSSNLGPLYNDIRGNAPV